MAQLHSRATDGPPRRLARRFENHYLPIGQFYEHRDPQVGAVYRLQDLDTAIRRKKELVDLSGVVDGLFEKFKIFVFNTLVKNSPSLCDHYCAYELWAPKKQVPEILREILKYESKQSSQSNPP